MIKYNIYIKQVIKDYEVTYSEKGELINSEKFNGLTSENAIQDINSFLEKEKIGKGYQSILIDAKLDQDTKLRTLSIYTNVINIFWSIIFFK